MTTRADRDEFPVSGDELLQSGDGDLLHEPHTMIDAAEVLRPVSQLQLAWRGEDTALIERMRSMARQMTSKSSNDLAAALDGLYMSLRTPRHDPDSGMPLIDGEGRVMWESDESGRPRESASNLTGQDIATAILKIQRVRADMLARLSELRFEALYARYVASDIYDDALASMDKETQSVMHSRANRLARADRYHALFRYHLYSTADALFKETTELLRRLDGVRYTLERGFQ